jgi:hypothetical protein
MKRPGLFFLTVFIIPYLSLAQKGIFGSINFETVHPLGPKAYEKYIKYGLGFEIRAGYLAYIYKNHRVGGDLGFEYMSQVLDIPSIVRNSISPLSMDVWGITVGGRYEYPISMLRPHFLVALGTYRPDIRVGEAFARGFYFGLKLGLGVDIKIIESLYFSLAFRYLAVVVDIDLVHEVSLPSPYPFDKYSFEFALDSLHSFLFTSGVGFLF